LAGCNSVSELKAKIISNVYKLWNIFFYFF
jgi:hypothetical protein